MFATHPSIERLTLRLPPGLPDGQRIEWQRRATSALDFVDVTPPGLPPQGILIVRRLDDPQPGVLYESSRRWADAACASLTELWRSAARPARGPVADGAAAVWFEDPAEWLACLSCDLASGRAMQRWWWRAWLRRGTPSLASLWRREPQWLPAALYLVQRASPQEARRQVASLSPAQATAVLEAVLLAHDVPVSGAHIAPQRLAALVGDLTLSTRVTPQELLQATLLALQRAPAAVRRLAQSSRFAPPSTLHADDADFDALQSTPAADLEPGPSDRATAVEAPGPAPAPKDEAPEPLRAAETSEALVLDDEGFAIAPETGDEEAQAALMQLLAAGAAAGKPPLPHPGTSQEVDAEVPLLAATDAESSPPVDDDGAIATTLAGIWYLVNVLTDIGALEANDADVSPWQMLATLAASLLEGQPLDPLWAALAPLTGREDALAEASPAELRWLASWRPTALAWWADAGVPAEELPDLLKQPGRLYLTRTHVDVVFNLEQIDLRLRQAGLDRNPGWLPDFARVFTFHYE